MVQRLTYRRRHSFASRSNKQRILRTPGASGGLASCWTAVGASWYRGGGRGGAQGPRHALWRAGMLHPRSSALPLLRCRRQAGVPAGQEEDHPPHLPHLRPAPARGEPAGELQQPAAAVGSRGLFGAAGGASGGLRWGQQRRAAPHAVQAARGTAQAQCRALAAAAGAAIMQGRHRAI